MIRVLLAVPLRILRESLEQVMRERDEMDVVGAVGYSALALALAQDLEPEVVVVDSRISGSDELIRSIVKSCEHTRVVTVGDCSEPSVSALPDAALTELIAAIHGAARSKVIKLPLVSVGEDRITGDGCLTFREREIVELIDKGSSNKEIARELNMAVSTVKNHVHHILKKLDVARRGQIRSAVRGHGQVH